MLGKKMCEEKGERMREKRGSKRKERNRMGRMDVERWKGRCMVIRNLINGGFGVSRSVRGSGSGAVSPNGNQCSKWNHN